MSKEERVEIVWDKNKMQWKKMENQENQRKTEKYEENMIGCL